MLLVQTCAAAARSECSGHLSQYGLSGLGRAEIDKASKAERFLDLKWSRKFPLYGVQKVLFWLFALKNHYCIETRFSWWLVAGR